VNHLDLVGWVNTARYKWAEIMGKEIEFRPATFYLGIADMLAREVEGQGDEGKACEEPDKMDLGKVGDGVELEEGRANVNNNKGKAKETANSDSERAQMVESLDKAGAGVHEAGGTDRPHKVPSLTNLSLQSSRRSDSKSSLFSFFTSNNNIPPLRSTSAFSDKPKKTLPATTSASSTTSTKGNDNTPQPDNSFYNNR